jgi:hypothetical protein
MKLGTVHDGDVYATEFRSVLVGCGESGFDTVGRLPVPTGGRAGLSYRLKSGRIPKSIVERYVGRFATVNVWPVTATVLVASADRWLFVSEDGGQTWRTSLELPQSSGPMGILPTAFCDDDGTWYVGEYSLDTAATPRVLRSDDRGRTWSTALSLPSVRHVHSVKTDPYTGELWITTGDVGDGCAIGRLVDGTFDRLGSGTQRWRAVDLAFTPSSVLWGMDSVYEPEKPIMLVRREQFDAVEPTVRTVNRLDSSVYYATTLETAGEHWVVFSTAMEPNTDSTAPRDRQTSFSKRARAVTASSRSGYENWHELASYEKRRVPADAARLRGYVPPANAYVFLASDSRRGVFLNPYNTRTDCGQLIVFPPSHFEGLG